MSVLYIDYVLWEDLQQNHVYYDADGVAWICAYKVTAQRNQEECIFFIREVQREVKFIEVADYVGKKLLFYSRPQVIIQGRKKHVNAKLTEILIDNISCLRVWKNLVEMLDKGILRDRIEIRNKIINPLYIPGF